MRTSETLLTQMAAGEIICCLGESCGNVHSEEAMEFHPSYDEYVLCVSTYITTRMREMIGVDSRKEKLVNALEYIIRNRTPETEHFAKVKLRKVIRQFGIDLCTYRAEIDGILDVNIGEIFKIVLAD